MATLVTYTCKSFIKLTLGPVLKILSSLHYYLPVMYVMYAIVKLL